MKKRIRIWFREYFSFSKTERNGILVLTGILFCLILFQVIIRNLPQKPLEKDQVWLDQLQSLVSLSEKTDSSPKKKKPIKEPAGANASLKVFDPNTATQAELEAAGFFPSIASRIVGYREKGGRYNKAEDLLKIYGMSPAFFESVRHLIKIQTREIKTVETNKTGFPSNKSNNKYVPDVIELNTADTVSLRGLPGIGPYFARKIVEYREKLGGYYHSKQLQEIWNFRSGLADTLSQYLIIDTTFIRKIQINSATETELFSHPYIGRKAKAIVNYRNARGGKIEYNDYKKILSLDKEDKEKLLPYLLFE